MRFKGIMGTIIIILVSVTGFGALTYAQGKHEGIVPVLKGSLEAMNAIRENTEPIPQIYELLQTIKRDGLKAI